jgi:hypothetical protein
MLFYHMHVYAVYVKSLNHVERWDNNKRRQTMAGAALGAAGAIFRAQLRVQGPAMAL